MFYLQQQIQSIPSKRIYGNFNFPSILRSLYLLSILKIIRVSSSTQYSSRIISKNKRLKRLKDIIKHKGCQRSARIKSILKNFGFVKNSYSFFMKLKTYLFFNIRNKSKSKSCQFIVEKYQQSINSYFKCNVHNKNVTFLSFFFELRGNISTTSIFEGFIIFSLETLNFVCVCYIS